MAGKYHFVVKQIINKMVKMVKIDDRLWLATTTVISIVHQHYYYYLKTTATI